MKNRIVESISRSIRDLHEYASPFYHAASTNALGGTVLGFFSHYFDPKIPMVQTLPHIFLRILFGAGAGVAYSLGGFCFSLPYLDGFAKLLDKHIKSETAKDAIYSFLSIFMTLLILVFFGYFLFLVYHGRVPVNNSYLTFPTFLSSLSNTNWVELAVIPLSGILIKGFIRALTRVF